MKINTGQIRTSLEFNRSPTEVFENLVPELITSMHLRGLDFEPGTHGEVTSKGYVIGKVKAWEPGKRISMQWVPASWEPEKNCRLEIIFEPAEPGCKIEISFNGLDQFIQDPEELLGWFGSSVAAPFINALSPEGFGNWITDRRARRPSGEQSRNVYRDPLYHYPGFKAILSELDLRPEDYLLDVACGGGAFLKMALKTGCKAAGVDHSPEMVSVSRKENRLAIEQGRLEIREANAEDIPFPNGTFTCITLMGALGFLKDPALVLGEFNRLLRKGGRIMIQGSDPELKGTPAAPYPVSDHLHFYDSSELEKLTRQAGFSTIKILETDLGPYAREAGIPEEHLPLFSAYKSRFIKAIK